MSVFTAIDAQSIIHRNSYSTPLQCCKITNSKTLFLKTFITQEPVYIFRCDPREKKTANRNRNYSVSLTPTACPH